MTTGQPERLSDDQIERLQRKHGGSWCSSCDEPGPCSGITALHELLATRAELRRLEGVRDAAQAFRLNVVHQFSDSAHQMFGELIGDRMDYWHALVTALLDAENATTPPDGAL